MSPEGQFVVSPDSRRVAPLGELTQPVLEVPKPSLPTNHARLARHLLKAMESRKAAESQRVSGGVQGIDANGIPLTIPQRLIPL